ncbi:hypothetical protein NL385_28025, partial [Klebsiella pneumoniae]|nr:hypothetical protein [Klebsiella pneumoniae]
PFVTSEAHRFEVFVVTDNADLTRASRIVGHVRRIIRANSAVSLTGGRCRFGTVTGRREPFNHPKAAGRNRRVISLTVPLTVA